jgi:hypothetical protein
VSDSARPCQSELRWSGASGSDQRERPPLLRPVRRRSFAGDSLTPDLQQRTCCRAASTIEQRPRWMWGPPSPDLDRCPGCMLLDGDTPVSISSSPGPRQSPGGPSVVVCTPESARAAVRTSGLPRSLDQGGCRASGPINPQRAYGPEQPVDRPFTGRRRPAPVPHLVQAVKTRRLLLVQPKNALIRVSTIRRIPF